MTTILAFAFVLGVLVFVHELGHFLMARWHGVRVLTFSLGFGPKLLKVKRGDTEYAHQRDSRSAATSRWPARTPKIKRTGSSDEFLSKTEVAALPDPDHGPGHEPGPGRHPAGRRADAGRRDPVVSGPAGRGRQGRGRIRRPSGPGCGPAIASSGSTARTCRPGTGFRSRSARRADRDVRLTIVRDGRESAVTRAPGERRAGSRLATSACCPTSIRRWRQSSAAVRPTSAGLKAGDVILADQRRARGVLARRRRASSRTAPKSRSRCASGATAQEQTSR